MCETTKENDIKKMNGIGSKVTRNPKHFLTWSATAANNRLQKMSKSLANNISKLQLKMEKAIPFQHEVSGSGELCNIKTCENGKLNDTCCGVQDNNNSHNHPMNPDVVNVTLSKVSPSSLCCSPSPSVGGNDSSEVKLINQMMKQMGEIGRYHYDTRIQSARIVSSHPSVSQSHSQGSADKIIQINIQSYNPYVPEEENFLGPSDSEEQRVEGKGKVTSVDLNVKSGVVVVDDMQKKKCDKMLDMQSLDLFYDRDSGTGSANTSISGSSSLSSPSVTDSPANSIEWSRETEVTALSPNLNSSSSPSLMSRRKRGAGTTRNNKKDFSSSTAKTGILKVTKKEEVTSMLIQADSNNSNNSGATIIESTDDTCLLIENNKSSRLRNGGGKNVEIFNKKNSVPSKNGNLGSPLAASTPLRLKSLISQAYPPSKLAVTIFEQEANLRQASWFQSGIPREIALDILRKEPIGSFIVRESTTKSGCFALSLRVPRDYQPCGIAHYLILKTSRGYKIKGFTKEFGSLTALITHHSILSELLPCPLSLYQYQTQPKSLRVSRANSSDFMEPEKLFIGIGTDF